MLKLNAKNLTMKRLIFIISVITISCHLTAQTKNQNQLLEEKSSKTIKASELKKKDFNRFQVSTKKKTMKQQSSKKNLYPIVESKNKSILKPKQ